MISLPGTTRTKTQVRTRPATKKNGYVLLDALVAVFISTIALTGVMWSIGSAAKMAALSKERILLAIEERNEFEKKVRIQTTK